MIRLLELRVHQSTKDVTPSGPTPSSARRCGSASRIWKAGKKISATPPSNWRPSAATRFRSKSELMTVSKCACNANHPTQPSTTTDGP